MSRARHLHGADAVVISQEPTIDGGITLAITRRENASASPLLDGESGSRTVPRDRLVNEVAARLKKHGASEAFVASTLAEVVARRGQGAHALDAAAEAIGARFETVKLPRVRGKARVIALAGAAGVGKTTTIAKLALRLVRAGRQVELLTFDAQRPGAVEQLRAWAELLGVPFDVARTGAEFRASTIATADLVLVDTCGRRERDVERLDRMRKACAAVGTELQTYLCLPASASSSTLSSTLDAFASLQPTAALITKLDETSEPISALERVLSAALPIAFLADGPEVHAHLHRATPERLADLCLRGRVS